MKLDIITAAFRFFTNSLYSFACELTGMSDTELCHVAISHDTPAGQALDSYKQLCDARAELAPTVAERECANWFDSIIA